MHERRYWDSAAFIAWIQKEEGRVEQLRAVLEAADRGETEIWTSALTIAEVLWPKGRPEIRGITARQRSTVRGMFRRPSIKIIQVDRQVAELAQDVVWDHGVKPKDAIHVASCLRWEIPLLETFDGPLGDMDGKIAEGKLVLRIAEPRWEVIADEEPQQPLFPPNELR